MLASPRQTVSLRELGKVRRQVTIPCYERWYSLGMREPVVAYDGDPGQVIVAFPS